MFTGIVEGQGTVVFVKRARLRGRYDLLGIKRAGVTKRLALGASLAVNGVCLTVAKKDRNAVFFHVIPETKRRSALGSLAVGERVNLERPLKIGRRIEGHFVLGHVDGVGKIRKILSKKDQKSLLISCPSSLRRFLTEKGSIAVDGVSLTLGKVRGGLFWVHCIPHTLKVTNFGGYKAGTRVNLEADWLTKLAFQKRGRFKIKTSY